MTYAESSARTDFVLPFTRAHRHILLALLLLLGLLDAWAGRRSYFAADSVSYMDMAAKIADGHFNEAVNGLWSPLYPAVLAFFIRPIAHDTVREFAVVRSVNFAIFALALLS